MDLLKQYGIGYTPFLGLGDAEDETTQGILQQYGRNKAYGESLFGQATNWLQGQKQKLAPTPLPDNASLGAQASEAGQRSKRA